MSELGVGVKIIQSQVRKQQFAGLQANSRRQYVYWRSASEVRASAKQGLCGGRHSYIVHCFFPLATIDVTGLLAAFRSFSPSLLSLIHLTYCLCRWPCEGRFWTYSSRCRDGPATHRCQVSALIIATFQAAGFRALVTLS